MMGAGKSAVGRGIAEAAGREYHDTDTLLQNRFGRPVTGIFSTYGEDTFRDHETSILKGLSREPYVLATGGGIVLREANWHEMRRLGRILYLRASAESLIEHLGSSQKKRPLLDAEDWQDRLRNLLEVRRPLYEKAEFQIDIDGLDIDSVTKLALKAFRSTEHDDHP